MSAVNCCQFLGRIASDPKVSQLPDNQGGTYTKVNFSFAVPKKISKAQKAQNDQAQAAGQPKPHQDVSFILMSAIGGTADIIAKYCPKGKPLSLTCEVFTFPKANTQNETVTAFNVIDVGFVPTDNTGNNAGNQAPQNYNQAPPQGGYQQPGASQNYGQPAPQAGYNQAPPQGGYQQPQGGFVMPDDDIPF